jgi:hypothetical protein
VKVLNCGHGFHPDCLDEWLFRRNACPLCKRVAISSLDPVENNRENPLNHDQEALSMTRQRGRRVMPLVQGGLARPARMSPANNGENAIAGQNSDRMAFGSRMTRLQIRSLRSLALRFGNNHSNRPVTPDSSSEDGGEEGNDSNYDQNRRPRYSGRPTRLIGDDGGGEYRGGGGGGGGGGGLEMMAIAPALLPDEEGHRAHDRVQVPSSPIGILDGGGGGGGGGGDGGAAEEKHSQGEEEERVEGSNLRRGQHSAQSVVLPQQIGGATDTLPIQGFSSPPSPLSTREAPRVIRPLSEVSIGMSEYTI